ncbi:hypothetical protein G646_gp161 [Serratia phage phiMAM1]|uniref:Uncharacterized protein n=2 Tax=Miltonvirus MAM1 TaxID=2169689 RepID=K7YH16_9CAUD|nr:hypothetical protein G646_gp161 [Serratia phage phiMAM1]AFX93629.1 hypothetical protein MAM_161 [Serratia phage phiMAM1]ASZ78941.1 hypothetical protein 2050H1_175 [Serratia phage 2050H1]
MIGVEQVVLMVMMIVVLPYAMCRAHGVPFTKILPLVIGMALMAAVVIFTVKAGL